jgi:hypothetical protein
MASNWPPKKNVAFTMYFYVYKSDGTIIANPTLTGSNVHTDGNTTEVTNSTLAVVDSTTGLCSIALAQATMNGDQIDGTITSSSTGAVVYTFKILTTANTQDEIVAGTVKAVVDVGALSGDATAADNAESFFDGTGYAGTNNVIPTVTNLTNERSKYMGGMVWLDSVNGTGSGTVSYANGIMTNPSAVLADGKTIADNVKLKRFWIQAGSDFTLATGMPGYVIMGYGYLLALGGRDISKVRIEGCEGLSGTGTCATGEAIIYDSHLLAITIGEADFVRCHLNGTVTLSQASVPYRFHDCTGVTAAKITFAAASQTAVVSRVSGALTIAGMASTDVLYIDGDGVVTLDNTNQAGSTVYVAGDIKLTNSGAGTVYRADHALEATLTAMKGATFSGSTDSLEAIRDRGDAAWITATGFATPTNITAASGVALAATQGDVTFGQVKITKNVANEGALHIVNANADGIGMLTDGGDTGQKNSGGLVGQHNTADGTGSTGQQNESTGANGTGQGNVDSASGGTGQYNYGGATGIVADTPGGDAVSPMWTVAGDLTGLGVVQAAPDITHLVSDAHDAKTASEKVAALVETDGGHDRFKATALETAPVTSVSGLATTTDVNGVPAATATAMLVDPTHKLATAHDGSVTAAVTVDEAAIADAVVAAMPPVTVDSAEIAGAVVSRLGALMVTVAAAFDALGALTICQGADYVDTEGTGLSITIAVAGAPNLTGATMQLRLDGRTFMTTDVTSDGTDWTVVWEATAAETAAIARTRQTYQTWAELASGSMWFAGQGIETTIRAIPVVTP